MQKILIVSQAIQFTPHDTKWLPCSARFVSCGITTSGKGSLSIYELGRGELKTKLECPALLPCGIKCNLFFQIAYQICIILTASFELAVVVTTWNFYRINSDFMAESFASECGDVSIKEAYHLTNAKDMAAPVG